MDFGFMSGFSAGEIPELSVDAYNPVDPELDLGLLITDDFLTNQFSWDNSTFS